MQNLTIALFQFDICWENKLDNRIKIEKVLTSNKLADCDLLLLPEMFSTGFSMNTDATAETMEGSTVDWLKHNAKEFNISIVGSLPIKNENEIFNRLVYVKPNGEVKSYDKRHLFVLGNEQVHFNPGNKQLIVEINGLKVCFMICYDLRFPVWSRNIKTEPYDVLIYVANWPDQRALAWKTLLAARAIENQCYVVGLNRIGEDPFKNKHSGHSYVFNFDGENLLTAENEEAIYKMTFFKDKIETYRSSFPFLESSDDFKIN